MPQYAGLAKEGGAPLRGCRVCMLHMRAALPLTSPPTTLFAPVPADIGKGATARIGTAASGSDCTCAEVRGPVALAGRCLQGSNQLLNGVRAGGGPSCQTCKVTMQDP